MSSASTRDSLYVSVKMQKDCQSLFCLLRHSLESQSNVMVCDVFYNNSDLLVLQFPDTVEFCEEMANMGKTVIVAALDGTFQRKVRL